jgi:hypothetical protein
MRRFHAFRTTAFPTRRDTESPSRLCGTWERTARIVKIESDATAPRW